MATQVVCMGCGHGVPEHKAGCTSNEVTTINVAMGRDDHSLRYIGTADEATTSSAEREAYYDKVLAPALAKLGKDAADHGLSFIAACEWSLTDGGRTMCLAKEVSLTMRFVELMLRLQGGTNFDRFLDATVMAARREGHQSLFFDLAGIPRTPRPVGQI